MNGTGTPLVSGQGLLEDERMMPERLNEAEHAVWSAFPRGEWVDFSVVDATRDEVRNGETGEPNAADGAVILRGAGGRR